jgi:hypothetical protein
MPYSLLKINQPMFQKDISPPFSALKNKPSKKPTWSCACYLLHARSLLGSVCAEDGFDLVLQNIG